MAGKSTTPTCCLTLPLRLEKWQADRLEKRFEIARQIYNTLLRFELKKLNQFENSEAYLEMKAKIQEQREKTDGETKQIKEIYKQLNKLRSDAGFSEYSFKTDIKEFYKHFNQNIKSHVSVHGIAPQVWQSFERYFFGNGKTVHFKKRGELYSLRGYSTAGKSGGTEIMFKGDHLEWNGLVLPLKINPKNSYEADMLKKRVKYCRIVKRPGKRTPHWYAQLILEGTPTVKYDKTGKIEKHPVGSGNVGIDIGPQTIAYTSETEVGLKELADRVQNIENEKRILQRKLDRSRRATNPENYAEDGTIKRGVKLTKNKSKRYLRSQKELAWLQHRQANIRKQQHNDLANHLMTLGNRFYVEDMAWPSLTHRVVKTEISEKTGKLKRKKRFGKSVGNKAPATMISLLDQKLRSRGYEGVIKVDPRKMRASQYNHLTGEYQKKELSERWNKMPDGKRIQRDLYSAFLLQHTNDEQNGFIQARIEENYNAFAKMHDAVIQILKANPKTITSMGISRTANKQNI